MWGLNEGDTFWALISLIVGAMFVIDKICDAVTSRSRSITVMRGGDEITFRSLSGREAGRFMAEMDMASKATADDIS